MIGKFVLGRSEHLWTGMFRGCNTQGRKGAGAKTRSTLLLSTSRSSFPSTLPLPSSSVGPAPLLPFHWPSWPAGPPQDLKGPLAALPSEPQLVPALRPAG